MSHVEHRRSALDSQFGHLEMTDYFFFPRCQCGILLNFTRFESLFTFLKSIVQKTRLLALHESIWGHLSSYMIGRILAPNLKYLYRSLRCSGNIVLENVDLFKLF